MKYKVGDSVKITACYHGHDFKIGEVVVIEEIVHDDTDPCYRAKGSDGEVWAIQDEEIIENNDI